MSYLFENDEGETRIDIDKIAGTLDLSPPQKELFTRILMGIYVGVSCTDGNLNLRAWCGDELLDEFEFEVPLDKNIIDALALYGTPKRAEIDSKLAAARKLNSTLDERIAELEELETKAASGESK